MRKPQIVGGSNFRNPNNGVHGDCCRNNSNNGGDKRSSTNNNKNNNNGGSFYELCLSSIWCLVFLFYCEVCLSDGDARDGEASQNPNFRSMSSGLVSNGKSSIGNFTVGNFTDSVFVNVNISININITSIQGHDSPNYCRSIPSYNEMEELAFHILGLGYGGLVCQMPPHLDQIMNTLEDHQHGSGIIPKLDKSQNMTAEEKKAVSSIQQVNVTRRLEPDGTSYNYASAAKGAKLVAHNKEAKGASNILGKDHDKYLINPCSVSGKFVVVELSEEILVDSVKIANYEHYSSNFKEFELLGSLRYPTDTWTSLGKYVAANVKQAQTFTIQEPQWVSYLNLSLISHFGTEHYCTLSLFEVYGVDVIERMLEDLMETSPGKPLEPNATALSSAKAKPENITGNGKKSTEVNSTGKVSESIDDEQKQNVDVPKIPVTTNKIPEPVIGKPNSRIPGDTVLKILMQKVRSLELNLSVLEEYLKEMNLRQGEIVPEIDKEMSKMISLLEKERKEVHELVKWKENTDRQLENNNIWKADIASRIDALSNENRILRSHVENVVTDQASLQNKELAILLVSFFFVCIAFLKLLSKRLLLTFGASRRNDVARSNTGGWLLILLSSSITMLITLF